MARDPNITVTERLIRAARRWRAAGDYGVDILKPEHDAEIFARNGDLEDAVAAYEKHCGLRPMKFHVRPILKTPPNESEGK